MSAPSPCDLELLYKTFWGKRNEIKELGIVVSCAIVPKDGCDPYELTKVCVDKKGNDVLRTLELPNIRLFPFFKPSSKILLRSEYVYMYEQVNNRSQSTASSGVVVTGYPGIGKTGVCSLLL
jgi:hypothetical protein